MQHRPTRSELAELINQVRLDRHISIRVAARIAEVPASTAQGWLAGRHFPTPALRPKFLRLVEALDLTDHLHPALWMDDLPESMTEGWGDLAWEPGDAAPDTENSE